MAYSLDDRGMSIAPDGKSYQIPPQEARKAQLARTAEAAEAWRKRGGRVVAVQGLGFVGSAVAAAVADARDDHGHARNLVIGVDLPSQSAYWKVAKVNEGEPPIRAPDPALENVIQSAVRAGNLRATTEPEAYGLADVVIIDVHLDVSARATEASSIRVDMAAFESALRTVGRHMRADALVLIETTVPPGTVELVAKPILLSERSQRGITAPLRLAHAYERVMPGPKYMDSIRRFWRTFSGIDAESRTLARDFLGSFIDVEGHPLWELDNPAASELAKVLENSYRATNIAFIHEWTLFAEKAGINLFEVVRSIRVRKGTHDNIRQPGFGVGGYCLTKDSLLAQWAATHHYGGGVDLTLTLQAIRINDEMPLHTHGLLTTVLDGKLAGKRVAILGASYLPDVADTRFSPTATLVDAVRRDGGIPVVHDPSVSTWMERPDITIEPSVARALAGADAVVFTVPHRAILDLDVETVLRAVGGPCAIVDAQDIIPDSKAELYRNAGCRVVGVGKGHWRRQGMEGPP